MESSREGRGGGAEAPVGSLKGGAPPRKKMDKPEPNNPSVLRVVAGSSSSNEDARDRGPSAVLAEKMGKIDSRSGGGGSSSSSSSSSNSTAGSSFRGGACEGKRSAST